MSVFWSLSAWAWSWHCSKSQGSAEWKLIPLYYLPPWRHLPNMPPFLNIIVLSWIVCLISILFSPPPSFDTASELFLKCCEMIYLETVIYTFIKRLL